MIWLDIAALVLLSAAFSALQEARRAQSAAPENAERPTPPDA